MSLDAARTSAYATSTQLSLTAGLRVVLRGDFHDAPPPAAQHQFLFLVGIEPQPLCTRQWGKSTVTAAKAVHRAYTVPGSLVLVLAPCGRQSGEFVRKAKTFVNRLGIRIRGDGDNAISIMFPNGSRIVGLPGNEANVRGFTASLILIDEAARVPDELYRAMRPSLAVGNGDLWLMSTPYGKRGFFWEEWVYGTEGWERIQVTGPECPRISKQVLEEERAKGDKWFGQEYLCEFGEVEGRVFSQESIDAAMQDFEPLDL